jgi:hypothetical protein
VNESKTDLFIRLRASLPFLATINDFILNQKMFFNEESFRLTAPGLAALSKLDKSYTFVIDEDMKSKHRMGLSRMGSPYFISVKRLVIFNEIDAMAIMLQGSIDQFLETCYHLDR